MHGYMIIAQVLRRITLIQHILACNVLLSELHKMFSEQIIFCHTPKGNWGENSEDNGEPYIQQCHVS